jgi:hypothetical protein
MAYSREKTCRAFPCPEYLLYESENGTKNTTECTLTSTFGLTEFGYVMIKL